MDEKRSPLYLYWPMTVTLVAWGFMNVPSSLALNEMAPFQLLLLRTAVAVLILAPVSLVKYGTIVPAPGDRLTSALIGFSGVLLNNVCFFNALKRTSLTNVAILFATAPLITAILARVFLGERLTVRRVCGIFVALAGAVVLLCKGDLALLADLKMNSGDLLELGAALTCAIMTILGRRVKSTPAVTVILCSMYTSFMATALILILSGASITLDLSGGAVLSVLYVGVFASGCGYVCQQMSIGRIGAGPTSAFLNGTPALAILGAVMFMGERVSLVQIVSAVVIFFGIFLNAGGARKG